MYDVDARLAAMFADTPEQLREPSYIVCSDLLYADDTMLISSSTVKLQAHLNLLVDEGRAYGLELNWSKTLALNICHDGVLV